MGDGIQMALSSIMDRLGCAENDMRDMYTRIIDLEKENIRLKEEANMMSMLVFHHMLLGSDGIPYDTFEKYVSIHTMHDYAIVKHLRDYYPFTLSRWCNTPGRLTHKCTELMKKCIDIMTEDADSRTITISSIIADVLRIGDTQRIRDCRYGIFKHVISVWGDGHSDNYIDAWTMYDVGAGNECSLKMVIAKKIHETRRAERVADTARRMSGDPSVCNMLINEIVYLKKIDDLIVWKPMFSFKNS